MVDIMVDIIRKMNLSESAGARALHHTFREGRPGGDREKIA